MEQNSVGLAHRELVHTGLRWSYVVIHLSDINE